MGAEPLTCGNLPAIERPSHAVHLRQMLVRLVVAAALVGLAAGTVLAQEAGRGSDSTATGKKKDGEEKKSAKQEREEEHKPADPDTGASTLSKETLGLLPNPYLQQGINFSLSYIGEPLANVSGGLRRGAVYEGRLNAAIDVDFSKLANWNGLSFHALVFQIHGGGLSRDFVGNLMTVSGIEALSTTRLYELWFEQKFANGAVSLRAGQIGADTEFITSKYSNIFTNTTFGWPIIASIDLPSGGPTVPFAALGARLKADINDHVTLLFAVFDGDPAGPGAGDPQTRNRYGLNFRTDDPPFFISELQVSYNDDEHAAGLPGRVKIGGWYHAGLFNDQRFAANGLSQADPGAAATPAQLRSDYGFYGILEQLLARFPGSGERGLGAFFRLLATPSDRNLVDLYADGGFNLMGPFASRPNDKLGLGLAYARISDRARELDRDFAVLANSPRPVRDYEALVTLSYLAQIRQGWTVLPSFQYIIHPGGGHVMDGSTAIAVKNAAVFGVRSVLKF
jgi:porin